MILSLGITHRFTAEPEGGSDLSLNQGDPGSVEFGLPAESDRILIIAKDLVRIGLQGDVLTRTNPKY